MAERAETFAEMLTGGHPNSLGRTIEVVDLIMANPARLADLYACYFSEDEVVRLRTSNAFKRIWREHPDWLVPYINRFLDKVSKINQPSTQWTFALLFLELDDHITPEQRAKAVAVLKRNLEQADDWIVLINTLQTLGQWAKADDTLKDWLRPHAERLAEDKRKSVAGNAKKVLKAVYSK